MASINAYNPHETGLVSMGVFASSKEIDNACFSLSDSIMAENTKRGTDPDSVCVIHRHKKIHRRFGINPKKNPGALTLLQALYEGEWRIATADEEKACIAADEQATAEELQRRSDRAAVVLVQKAAQGIAGNMPAVSNPGADFTAQLADAMKQIAELKAQLAAQASTPPHATGAKTDNAANDQGKGKKTK